MYSHQNGRRLFCQYFYCLPRIFHLLLLRTSCTDFRVQKSLSKNPDLRSRVNNAAAFLKMVEEKKIHENGRGIAPLTWVILCREWIESTGRPLSLFFGAVQQVAGDKSAWDSWNSWSQLQPCETAQNSTCTTYDIIKTRGMRSSTYKAPSRKIPLQ